MEYQVLARKWRPQQFDDVVGQAHVTETLKNALKSSRLAHAYLFVGPRGIGKTSIARIFAKALNCETGQTTNPCDDCPSCKEVMAGNSLDVMEIDGASNNGVDQVRELRETVKFVPTRGRFKIYIIDEVHMLSTAAFNALLKTLEEPPPHVKFIFATTEPDKILATIISRCQRFDLRRIPSGLIVERLKEVAKSEKVKIEDDALLAIARGAEGGLRDAESALDQIISFKGKKIAEEDVLSVFGLVSRTLLEELAEHVLTGNIQSVVQTIGRLDEAGKDLQRLVVELLGHFRNLLVCLNVTELTETQDLSAGQIKTLQAQATLTNTDRVLRVTQILSDTLEKMRFALSRRTLLETALIRCARAAVVVSLEEVLEKLNTMRQGGQGGAAGATSAQPVRQAPPVERPQPSLNLDKKKVAEDQTAYTAEPTPSTPAVNPASDLARLQTRWEEIGQSVNRIAVMAGTALRDAKPVAVESASVVIGFDPEFASEATKFKVSRNRKALEHVLSTELNRRVTVDCRVLGEQAAATAGLAQPKPDESAPETGSSPIKTAAGKTGKKIKKVAQNLVRTPEVETVLDMFNGSVVDVRV
ncbi:MAG: DNA polymerase III subunit gamma/tau [Kiritimatiellae bacterium]|nr:DNA polymerase III subunit gamma/tau [Kiritimatiellia bacterium]